MTKSFETNQEKHFRDFGYIVLYQRADRQSGRYYARIKIDGSKGYRKISTGKTDPRTALNVAETKYRELILLQDRTGGIHHKSFLVVMREWEESVRQSSNRSPKLIDDYVEKMERYAVPFFKKFSGIAEIREVHLEEWVDYRRSNYIRSVPKNTTITRELAGIKQVFEFAVSREYLPNRLKFPVIGSPPNPRPAFTRDQYRRLYRGLRQSVTEGQGHPIHYRARFYLQHLVLILANSGVRIGELRGLTWNDIENRTDGKGVLMYVRGKTKKRRQVVPQPSTAKYLERIKVFREIELGQPVPPNEPVFCSSNGLPVESYKKGFKTLLKSIGLSADDSGNPFTLYSLRHTYATMRIINGVSHYFIASNMGTSVEMLMKFYGHLVNESVADEITRVR
jgi:integrase